MSKAGTSKSGLFLMELLMVILLFAICAAICLQMFAFASKQAQQAEELSYGSMTADSCASCFQAYDGDLLFVADQLGGVVTNNSMDVYYDENWQAVSSTSDAGCYQLTCEKTGNIGQITVVKYGQTDSIYTLTVQVKGGGSL